MASRTIPTQITDTTFDLSFFAKRKINCFTSYFEMNSSDYSFADSSMSGLC